MLFVLTLLSAPTFACGPYGGGPLTVTTTEGAPAARFVTWSSTLEVRKADKWKALDLDLSIEQVRVDGDTLVVLGWNDEGEYVTQYRTLTGKKTTRQDA